MAYKTYLTAGTHAYVTQGYYNGSYFHGAMDIVLYTNPPFIRACKGGTVARSHYSSSFGNVVYINHDDNTTAIYAHMDSRYAEEGKTVEAGDILGIMGNTGNSSGAHVHVQLQKTGSFDPKDRINPSALIGLPDKIGDYETEFASPSNPPVPPQPPPTTENGNIVILTATFSDGKIITYPSTISGEHLYFNDSQFYRCLLDGTEPQIYTKIGLWTFTDIITNVSLAGYDITGLTNTILTAITDIINSITQIDKLRKEMQELITAEANAREAEDNILNNRITTNRNNIENIENQLITIRSDISDLDDRVTALENK